MKTRNFLFALSLGLIIIGITAALTARPIEQPNPQPVVKMGISYVVQIHHGQQLAGFHCNYWVVVTDGNGNMVAPPQDFRIGTWTYQFRENGPVVGTRKARIGRHPQLICPGTYSFSTDAKSGYFANGLSYLFNLYPIAELTTGD